MTLWLVALAWSLRTLDIPNDQFGRISPGRQILTSGELPFRDFLDPGYFLTEFSSAAMQWLFGQGLLGELLLNSLFIATGCVCVCLLSRRLNGRWVPAMAAGTFALLASPRAYDYDKALLYPLGLLLTVRWLEKPSPGRGLALALTLVVAALYRYDNGVFLGVAALVGVVVLEWQNRRRLMVAGLSLAGMIVSLCIPVLLFLHLNGGIVNAADQTLTYGLRERARTRLPLLPRVHVGGSLLVVVPSPPSENHVGVRWSPAAATTERRAQLARRLGLADEQRVGPPENRTWRYTLPDASFENVRRLVNDPQVEDTDGVDRNRLRLSEPESMLLKVQRRSPVFRIRVLPEVWTLENAEAFLYYVLLALPIAGVVTLLLVPAAPAAVQRAGLAALITFCVLVCALVLRDPVSARVGGMAGPFCVLAVCVFGALSRRFVRAGTLMTAIALPMVAISLGIAVGWHRQVFTTLTDPLNVVDRLRRNAVAPPSPELLPTGRVRGIVDYVRACTLAADRVYTSWFVPELFYFAQREFGGASVATFGGHWSELRFQRRTIAALEAHPTPVVIVNLATYEEFRAQYALIDAYLGDRYLVGGVTGFGDPEAGPNGYRVLVRKDRHPITSAGPFGLPCFAPAPSI